MASRGDSLKKKAALNVDSSRQKIFASAERLFAERGFNGVSVRDIANDAGVNSALVGYSFGGKQGLLSEVYTRHCTPLNQERMRLLKEFSRPKSGPTLEQVLEAFIRPSLEVTVDHRGRSNFTRLRAILSGENSALLEKLIADNFDQSSRTFVEALRTCLPHLTIEDIFWRFHFLLGTIYYTGTGPHRIRELSNGRCNPSDPVACAKELIPFLAAGFRAPKTMRGWARSSRRKR
jgi:AcrR family transcriptional regulator